MLLIDVTTKPLPSHSHSLDNHTMTIADRDSDSGSTVVILSWVLIMVSVLVVTLRLYTRMARVRNVGADDYLMICSVVRDFLNERRPNTDFHRYAD
jgi:hypothetical protein